MEDSFDVTEKQFYDLCIVRIFSHTFFIPLTHNFQSKASPDIRTGDAQIIIVTDLLSATVQPLWEYTILKRYRHT